MPWLFFGINTIYFVLLSHYNVCFMTLSEIVDLKVKCDSYLTKTENLKCQHITAIQCVYFLFYHQFFSSVFLQKSQVLKKCSDGQLKQYHGNKKSRKDLEHHFPYEQNILHYTCKTKKKSVTKSSIYHCTIENSMTVT